MGIQTHALMQMLRLGPLGSISGFRCQPEVNKYLSKLAFIGHKQNKKKDKQINRTVPK